MLSEGGRQSTATFKYTAGKTLESNKLNRELAYRLINGIDTTKLNSQFIIDNPKFGIALHILWAWANNKKMALEPVVGAAPTPESAETPKPVSAPKPRKKASSVVGAQSGEVLESIAPEKRRNTGTAANLLAKTFGVPEGEYLLDRIESKISPFLTAAKPTIAKIKSGKIEELGDAIITPFTLGEKLPTGKTDKVLAREAVTTKKPKIASEKTIAKTSTKVPIAPEPSATIAPETPAESSPEKAGTGKEPSAPAATPTSSKKTAQERFDDAQSRLSTAEENLRKFKKDLGPEGIKSNKADDVIQKSIDAMTKSINKMEKELPYSTKIPSNQFLDAAYAFDSQERNARFNIEKAAREGNFSLSVKALGGELGKVPQALKNVKAGIKDSRLGKKIGGAVERVRTAIGREAEANKNYASKEKAALRVQDVSDYARKVTDIYGPEAGKLYKELAGKRTLELEDPTEKRSELSPAERNFLIQAVRGGRNSLDNPSGGEDFLKNGAKIAATIDKAKDKIETKEIEKRETLPPAAEGIKKAIEPEVPASVPEPKPEAPVSAPAPAPVASGPKPEVPAPAPTPEPKPEVPAPTSAPAISPRIPARTVVTGEIKKQPFAAAPVRARYIARKQKKVASIDTEEQDDEKLNKKIRSIVISELKKRSKS